MWMQQNITAARISAAPMRVPMTIPAMAPPDSPVPDAPAPAPVPVADGVLDDVLEGNSGGIDTVVGRLTPTHRLFTFALTQHELVELTVLSAQYEQSPCRLPWYPHSEGSLLTALMQLPLSASAGLEQRVKSARI
jgi:hypothetical protein